MTLPPFFFVFDVESVGLHGQPFAVGWVVIDTATGAEVDANALTSYFPAACISATPQDVEWVRQNVIPAIEGMPGVGLAAHVRQGFWRAWKMWEKRGAMLAADVPWPVEARFLMQCAKYTFYHSGKDADGDHKTQLYPETQSGPYPLIDIASVRLAKGLDPLETCDRLPSERPAHNPLADARQSARLLMEALRA